MSPTALSIGFLAYPDLTQLDLTAPHQAFGCIPGVQLHRIWKTLDPVIGSLDGLPILPNVTFADCPSLDVLCIPGGGGGLIALLQDAEVLDFIRLQGQCARYVTAVCTGSLVLAAAGLLDGYRASTHWKFRDCLAAFGVEVSSDRVVIDRNRITGGGVTAGLDFALVVIAELCGPELAQTIQLLLEYNPQPPYSGDPDQADPQVLDMIELLSKELVAATLVACQRS
jgi:cyclohexyl-isocyanide hydratase